MTSKMILFLNMHIQHSDIYIVCKMTCPTLLTSNLLCTLFHFYYGKLQTIVTIAWYFVKFLTARWVISRLIFVQEVTISYKSYLYKQIGNIFRTFFLIKSWPQQYQIKQLMSLSINLSLESLVIGICIYMCVAVLQVGRQF